MKPYNPDPIKNLNQIRYVAGFKKTLDFLYDGVPDTIKPLMMIQQTYKEWQDIYNWLFKNNIYGQKLVEFFQNESPDGGGVHMGVTHILSRMKGHKFNTVGIKGDELQ